MLLLLIALIKQLSHELGPLIVYGHITVSMAQLFMTYFINCCKLQLIRARSLQMLK